MLTKCANCGKPIDRRPYRIKKYNFCSNKCQMVFEYANGIRKKSIVIKAQKQYQKLAKTGKYKGRSSWNAGKSGQCPQLAKFGKDNPMYGKRGKKSPSYKNGKYTADKKRYWSTSEYQNWRKFIFQRDHYTCQICGDKTGGNLEAHHIKSVANYPKLIFKKSNGITLCKKCHHQLHKSLDHR